MIESPRSDLDAAIDRVAAKLVEVPADDQLLSRTLADLPARSATPWFLAMHVQLPAAAAVVLIAFVFASPSRELSEPEHPPVAVSVPAVERIPDPWSPVPNPRSPVPDPRSPIPDPRSPIRDPRSPMERLEDHERSLAPVAAIEAIELSGIAPPAMALEAAAALEPLVLPELALDTRGDS